MGAFIQRLPLKFNAYDIDHPNFPNLTLRDTIHNAFNQPGWKTVSNRSYILFNLGHLPNFIVKRNVDNNGDVVEDPEVLIYRVRKADKIRQMVERYGWQQHINIAPRKYLYLHQGNWHVISPRLQLAPNPPSLNPPYHPADHIQRIRTFFAGLNPAAQAALPRHVAAWRRHANPNVLPRDINPAQALALASFAFKAGLTDLTLGNLLFDNTGRIAIVDTEPLRRGIVKKVTEGIYGKFATDKEILKKTQALAGTAFLKSFLGLPEAERAVEEVENHHIFKSLIKSTITVTYIALAYLCVITASIPLIMQVALATLIGLKLGTLVEQNCLLYHTFTLNRTRNVDAIGELLKEENQI